MSRFVELISSRRVPHSVALALSRLDSGDAAPTPQNHFRKPHSRIRLLPARTTRRYPRPLPSSGGSCRNIAPPRELPQYQPSAAARRRSSAPLSYPAPGRDVPGAGRDFLPTRRRQSRSRPRAASGQVRSRRPPHRRRAAPRLSSAPPTRWRSQTLQRLVRGNPASQWLWGPARSVARPATHHSASHRDRARLAACGTGHQAVAAGLPATVHSSTRATR